jgi:hypothetical protein
MEQKLHRFPTYLHTRIAPHLTHILNQRGAFLTVDEPMLTPSLLPKVHIRVSLGVGQMYDRLYPWPQSHTVVPWPWKSSMCYLFIPHPLPSLAITDLFTVCMVLPFLEPYIIWKINYLRCPGENTKIHDEQCHFKGSGVGGGCPAFKHWFYLVVASASWTLFWGKTTWPHPSHQLHRQCWLTVASLSHIHYCALGIQSLHPTPTYFPLFLLSTHRDLLRTWPTFHSFSDPLWLSTALR